MSRFRLQALRPKYLIFAFAALLLSATKSQAQGANSLKNAYDIGVDFGTLIPSRNGLQELVPGWGGRLAVPTQKGVFELNFFSGMGNGIIYRTGAIDFRLDIAVEFISAHFLLGFHADQFEQADPPASTRFAGGWHYGGGITQSIAGPISARFDFRHRFSPGQVVQITLGLTYRFGSRDG